MRAPLVLVQRRQWGGEGVERIVIPPDPAGEDANSPSRGKVVEAEPLTRCALADGGADYLPALRVPLHDDGTRIKRRKRAIAVTRAALEIGDFGLYTQKTRHAGRPRRRRPLETQRVALRVVRRRQQ